MSLWAVILIGVGVSADAFAAALAIGVRGTSVKLRAVTTVSAVFAVFQMAMPLLGWLLASWFSDYLAPVDHWIAFVLLGAIGLNMIRESFAGDGGGDGQPTVLGMRRLLLLGLATSIDALAVGVSLAVMNVSVVLAVSVFGVTTFLFSAAGMVIGHQAGLRFRRPAEMFGGIVLIVIGTRILVEHLTAG